MVLVFLHQFRIEIEGETEIFLRRHYGSMSQIGGQHRQGDIHVVPHVGQLLEGADRECMAPIMNPGAVVILRDTSVPQDLRMYIFDTLLPESLPMAVPEDVIFVVEEVEDLVGEFEEQNPETLGHHHIPLLGVLGLAQFDDPLLKVDILFPDEQGLADAGAATTEQTEKYRQLDGMILVDGRGVGVDTPEVPFRLVLRVDVGDEIRPRGPDVPDDKNLIPFHKEVGYEPFRVVDALVMSQRALVGQGQHPFVGKFRWESLRIEVLRGQEPVELAQVGVIGLGLHAAILPVVDIAVEVFRKDRCESGSVHKEPPFL